MLRAGDARMALSARGYDRVRKVARTIADLAGEERISADHLAEALASVPFLMFRQPMRG